MNAKKSTSQSFRHWTLWGSAVFSLISLPFVVRAVPLPYTSATGLGSGQPISASKLVQNFEALNNAKFETLVTISSSPSSCPGPNGSAYLTAYCGSGKQVVAGGCDTNPASSVVLVASKPHQDPSRGAGWICRYDNKTSTDLSGFTCEAFVICIGP